jgi:hypothetical protein
MNEGRDQNGQMEICKEKKNKKKNDVYDEIITNLKIIKI